ncbi:hypothetical protein I302_105855 [Kwoniella bestiolae CBS 10118]|uniref:PIN domain-containing protein n=1 Tax=Kwoniella bestiolae CBS 10118 TaxID=1296100 RepID=A0A1B9G2C1_9TREE|nr:hypothetical protein I302_04979 [Kwoniella bestiolae CBS 10118]OCF25169.1 hypothetical protein I302_04979 [Kwoniella bestiolae CBS 10118]
MMLRHEEEMIWEPEHASDIPVHYLAVDTNIFISHLNLIRTIHTLLLAVRPSPLVFLLPSIVIHELDTLKSSRAPSEPGSPISLGRLVQAANTWLLEVHRNRRFTGIGALRCQSLREKWDTTIKDHGQNDDQILDCCLHFANHGAKVTLWTNDKNLSVKAEANEIPTLGAQNMTLTRFFRSLDDTFPDSLWREVHRLSIYEYDEPSQAHRNGKMFDDDLDMDMDMDHDLHDPSHHQINGNLHQEDERRYPYLLPQNTSLTLPPSAWHPISLPTTPIPSSKSPFQQSRQPNSTSPTSLPMDRHSSSSSSISMQSHSTSPTKPSKTRRSRRSSSTSNLVSTSPSTSSNRTPTTNSIGPSRILLNNIQLSLLPFAHSLLLQCPDPPHPPNQPIDTNAILKISLQTLNRLDETLQQQGDPPSSNLRISLIRSISAIKTIMSYIECYTDWTTSLDKGRRRIRSGEVVQCLNTLQVMFNELGVDGGAQGEVGLREVIEEIRRLD